MRNFSENLKLFRKRNRNSKIFAKDGQFSFQDPLFFGVLLKVDALLKMLSRVKPVDIDNCLLFQFFLTLLVSPHRPLGSRWRLVFYCKVKVLWLRIWFSSIERVKLHNLAVKLSHHLLNCGFLLFILHFALID